MARRLIGILLVVLTLFITGLAASWLQGCASLSAGVDWDTYPTSMPLPAYIVRVDNVAQKCSSYPNFKTLACASRDYSAGVCTIYVDRDPTPEIIAHELFHCSGMNHEYPGVPR